MKKVLITILLLTSFYFICNNKKTINNDNENNNSTLAIMVEQQNGDYEASNSIPEGYTLNTTRSGCENGGTVSYDGTNVTMSSNASDKCYLYFDIAE